MTALPRHIVVIGAGIVGVSAALYLQRDGCRVTLLDRLGPGEGASKGNASVIAVDSCVPTAVPGLLWEVPGLLLDPLGPLTIRWRYLPRLVPWLWRFMRAATPARVEAASIALRALLLRALDDYAPLLEGAGAAAMLRRTGWLAVYESERKFAAAKDELELQRRRGVPFELLDADQVRRMEPTLNPAIRRGVFFPEPAYVTDNFALVQRLAEACVRGGGTLRAASATGFEIGPEGVRAVRTDAGTIPCDAVVVAAGAWSRPLARQLGYDPPLETERGYHAMLANPAVLPRLPIYCVDHVFVATPLDGGLRFAGTDELAGLEAPPDYARADVLLAHGRRLFPGLGQDGAAGVTRWMGCRPSLPDSLPVIGVAPRQRNAVLAFGHGHLGLTLGAVTGRLVADLVAGRDPGLDMAPFRPDRF